MKQAIYKDVKCLHPECVKEAKARGYCQVHYNKALSKGIIKSLKLQCQIPCIARGCDKPSKIKGLCGKHYQRYKKHGDTAYKDINMHGMSKTSEYKTWEGIKDRCYNPKNKSYKHYGGRGIKVSEFWLEAFVNFLTDIGEKPNSEYEIDRINNNGDYEKSNCHWVLRTANARNKRSTKLTIDLANKLREDRASGLTLANCAKKYGIAKSTTGSIVHNKIWRNE